MNFSEALEAMKAGKKVIRSSKSFETYIIGQFPLDEPGTKTDIIAENGFFKKISVFGSEGILAEDWEVVDEYPKVKLHFKCPRCNQNSEFEKKFLLVDPKGRDIIECEHCKNKVEIKKEPAISNACDGETEAKNSQYTLPAEYIGYGRWRVTKPLPVDELTIKVRRDIENGKL